MKVFIYVMHTRGTGHLFRMKRLASFLKTKNVDVLLVSGGTKPSFFKNDDVNCLFIPPLCAKKSFKTLETVEGLTPSDTYMKARKDKLVDAFRSFNPDILITEHFPLGRFQLEDEYQELISEAKQKGVKIAASVRDILFLNDNKKDRALKVLEHYDAIFVHGDKAFISLEQSLNWAADFQDKIYYTGYIAPQIEHLAKKREILISCGGLGQNMFDISYKSYDMLHFGVNGYPHRDDFTDKLKTASLSLSQSGYNTVAECLAFQTPMLLMPYAEEGEKEQNLRAKVLQEKGLAVIFNEEHDQSAQIEKALNLDMHHAIDLDGLSKTYDYLMELSC